MRPSEALEEIAYLLESQGAPRHRTQAFRRAADVVVSLPSGELESMARAGSLKDLPGIGETTERVIIESLAGGTPSYLSKLAEEVEGRLEGPAKALREALQGDCHGHSDWSDGSSPIEVMARAAQELGHRYWSLTDHSARLTVAHGLDADRLRKQLDEVSSLNDRLDEEGTGFRVLAGMEVDILEDGSLDQDEDLLGRLDVVVGSVHSKLSMEPDRMTERMIRAIESPHVDILGHCTGRLRTGRGRPESKFDAQRVFAACASTDTAVEVNCRPERLDPPRRLLAMAAESGCKFSIDTDAHAPGQLEWQHHGCRRVADAGIPAESVVNTWPADRLVEWTASHSA